MLDDWSDWDSTLLGAHHDLLTAFEGLGVRDRVPTLVAAADLSSTIIEDSRRYLQGAVPCDESPFDVIAVGSIARLEASQESDFDYLVVVHGLPQKARHAKDLLAAVERLREEQLELKAPGSSGMFGKVISGSDLTERIGLQDDTNLSHSRRILILEESVSLYQPDLHSRLIRLMLDRYLADYDEQTKRGVPRFLLNDVIRYWRTIAVDYQAKRWEERDPWGLRYLKLILSRKLAFAGTLVPLLLCQSATVEDLALQFELPALARLARLRGRLEEEELLEALREVVLIAEEFAVALGNPEFRDEVKKVRERRDMEANSEFRRMRDRGRELQSLLQRVFFESSALGEASCKYLSF